MHLLVALLSITLPATPAGKKLDSWLHAFNAGDYTQLRALYGADRDASAKAGQDARMAWVTGGLDVGKIENSTDNKIELLVHARLTETWFRLSLRVAGQAPYPIEGVMLLPTDPPEPEAEKLQPAEIARRLHAYVEKLAKGGRFSGAVLVVKDGTPIFEEAAGLASRAWSAPNRVDTKFNLGSMNKMFTAVAIAQLYEKGKLDLDDKVGRFLPDFPNAEVREKVTVRHLLSHTSGLGGLFGPKFDEKKLGIREVRDYLPLIAEEKLEFEPGSKWSYSNSGFELLGAIVEKASGENYFAYIRKHVYAPAGMKDTDCYDVDRDIPNLASGYTRDEQDGSWATNIFLSVVRGGPGGGGYSTVGDLGRFAAALKRGKLLKPATVKELITGKNDTPFGGRYGFGFHDASVHGHRVVGHSGGFRGISSNLDIFWDDGWVVAVLANVDAGSTAVKQKARELIAR
jgi:CubicO group peptidase (beta-lactamase class C family)